MKKFMFTLVTLLTMAVTTNAMSYEQARQQALFLADKMAYELNLTDEQYEACYEINLDYLMGVNTQDDLYGVYWERRNLDLSYILLDWQYRMYCNAAYFYRPLYWNAGYWHFHIYSRYTNHSYFYFGRPHFYDVYRGGHAWHMNGGRSWYHGRTFGHGGSHPGMKDRFNQGHYGRGGGLDGRHGGGPGMGGSDRSSTRSHGNIGNGGQRGNNGVQGGHTGVGQRGNGGANGGTRGSQVGGGSQRGNGGAFGGATGTQRHPGSPTRGTGVSSRPSSSVVSPSTSQATQSRPSMGSSMQQRPSSGVSRSGSSMGSARPSSMGSSSMGGSRGGSSMGSSMGGSRSGGGHAGGRR